jgi:beta-ketoacyl synthase-like protein
VSNMRHGLDIEEWAFWSPESSTPGDWLAHWRRPGARSAEAKIPDDAIPSAHRRRMSNLSKLAVQAAILVSRNARPDFMVFCSQHGELVRTQELLCNIVAGEELSPAAFSQSVHNTGAGLYSIVAHTRAPATSLASGPSTFSYGWIEAEGYLLENPAHRALLVCCEEPLPDVYRPFSRQAQCTYAVALMLRLADRGGVAVELTSSDADDDVLPFAPSFMAWWLSAERALRLTADRQCWIWSRDGA